MSDMPDRITVWRCPDNPVVGDWTIEGAVQLRLGRLGVNPA